MSVGSSRVCPKVALEGIPEWMALREQLQEVCALLGTRHRLVSESARRLGIPLHHADGSRKTKEELSTALGEAGGMRKRPYSELQAQVQRAGCGTRTVEGGKRRKLTRAELQAVLDRQVTQKNRL